MKAYLSSPERKKKIRLLGCDAALVFLVFVLSYLFRIAYYEQGDLASLPGRLTWLVAAGIVVYLTCFYVFGLYDWKTSINQKVLLINIVLSVLTATTAMAVLSFAFPEAKMGRILLALHFLLMILFLFAWRTFYKRCSFGSGALSLLVVGWNKTVEKLLGLLSTAASGYSLDGLVVLSPGAAPGKAGKPAPVYASLDEALTHCQGHAVVIAESLKDRPGVRERLMDLKFQGKDILSGPDFYRIALGRVPAEDITEDWLLFTAPSHPFRPALYQHAKFLIDVVISAVVLAAAAPVLLFVAGLIKIDSRGPVLFKQERLGLNEKPFTLLKFRTMVVGAEKRTGPCWAAENDSRFTRVGRMLRKTRLDEFPQFINVLKGEMSLVGPRPIRKHFAEDFARKFPFYRLRFKVKPGITGWAQVNMDYVNTEADQYEKLEYELFYLYHQSLFLDAFIILKTLQSMIRLRGG